MSVWLVLAMNPPTDRPREAESWYVSIPTTISFFSCGGEGRGGEGRGGEGKGAVGRRRMVERRGEGERKTKVKVVQNEKWQGLAPLG